MKTTRLSICTGILLFTLLLSSCSTPGVSETPAAVMSTASATALITQEPVPTATLQPTEAPPPLPCMIAFDSDRDGNREIYIMSPDGKDPVNLTNNPADDRDPSWSADGNWIAFVSNRENEGEGGQFIYVMDADGNNVHQISTETGSEFPDWSHDGKTITYSANGDIYIIPADGSGQSINLTNSPEVDVQSSWSPDDSQIVWLSGDEGNRNIFLMNADGSNARQITEIGKVTDIEWTADGRLFAHWDNPEAGCFNCVLDADGSNVTDAGGKGSIQEYLPFWTLEGDRVECVSADINGADDEIYLVSDIYPDIFLNLTNNPANDRNPDWPSMCGPRTEVATVELEKTKDPNAIVIGYAGDDQWQKQRKHNFQIACEELGIQCVYGEMPELIAQGVDAIVQNTNNIVVKGLHQDILNARDKGIPVFLLDAETITDGAYSITVNQQEWVTTSLSWMFENIGAKTDFVFFDLQFNDHKLAIEEMLKKYPQINVVQEFNGKYNWKEKITEDVRTLIQTYPNLGAIWTNQGMSDVIWGATGSGIPSEDWPLMMCEPTKLGLYIWKDRLVEFPDMKCIAVSNPPGIAYDAVYAAYYLVMGYQIDESVLGGEYGHSLYVNIPVVTQENLQESIDKINDQDDEFIVDELMIPGEILENWFLE